MHQILLEGVKYYNMIKLKHSIPDSFLESETRDGFLVSKERKEIWAVELDLYLELIRVCDKFGLTVYADGGTMIGAIRHHGFIPWDDDIDLSISRKDYDILCSVAKDEFKPPYFFQTEDTDPGSGRGHAQLRNSDTTAIIHSEFETGYFFNQGIFIDLFPLDEVPEDKFERKAMIEELEHLRGKAISYAKLFYSSNPGTGFRKVAAKFLQFGIRTFHLKYNNRYYSQREKKRIVYNGSGSRFWANLYRMTGDFDRLVWEKSWFDSTIEVPFEMITIKVPAMYEEYLTSTYGDWKIPVHDSSTHGNTIFDTDKSYLYYLSGEGGKDGKK